MKIRLGFVSNSSSASFILDKRYLSSENVEKIMNFTSSDESWEMEDDDDFIRGFTIMDNDCLYEFIKNEINPRMNAIVSWSHDG